jgi:hypothetical protein
MQTSADYRSNERCGAGLVAAERFRINFIPVNLALCSGDDWLARRSTCQAKELSMSPSNLRSVSPELPHKTAAVGDVGAHHPMSQQDAGDCHGHEMHPQKLVQLVGCHDPNAGKHEEAA